MTINSVPQGASFTTNTGHKGTTPAVISIPDKTTLRVKVELAGYEPAEVVLSP